VQPSPPADPGAPITSPPMRAIGAPQPRVLASGAASSANLLLIVGTVTAAVEASAPSGTIDVVDRDNNLYRHPLSMPEVTHRVYYRSD
jgi:hypothetical protein